MYFCAPDSQVLAVANFWTILMLWAMQNSFSLVAGLSDLQGRVCRREEQWWAEKVAQGQGSWVLFVQVLSLHCHWSPMSNSCETHFHREGRGGSQSFSSRLHSRQLRKWNLNPGLPPDKHPFLGASALTVLFWLLICSERITSSLDVFLHLTPHLFFSQKDPAGLKVVLFWHSLLWGALIFLRIKFLGCQDRLKCV